MHYTAFAGQQFLDQTLADEASRTGNKILHPDSPFCVFGNSLLNHYRPAGDWQALSFAAAAIRTAVLPH
ncbi:hypothetical protein [Rugamonas sp. DEMB1]|uniref:hypothetical protein n=1 Tax=Rugamonas sp. DEMB1 TaxID=3039386 RepID=UPI002447E608|nr:hypothetical protein [Rugamonas sp. DEMB1]WGG53643.1 hypothetical protein QC826_19160 [Rugamonas sp. DEMB1]